MCTLFIPQLLIKVNSSFEESTQVLIRVVLSEPECLLKPVNSRGWIRER